MPISPPNFKPNKAKSKFHDLPLPRFHPKSLSFEDVMKPRELTVVKSATMRITSKRVMPKRGLTKGSLSERILGFIRNMGRPVSIKELQRQFIQDPQPSLHSRLSWLVQEKYLTRPMQAFYEVVT